MNAKPDANDWWSRPPLWRSTQRALDELGRLVPSAPLRLHAGSLLMERAQLSGLSFEDGRAPGGACRLLPTRDGVLAVNLPRHSDWDLINAWLESSLEAWTWADIADAVRSRKLAPLIARSRALGMAVAASVAVGAGEGEGGDGAENVEEAPRIVSTDRMQPGHESRSPALSPRSPLQITHGLEATPDRRSRERPLVVDLSSLWAGPLCGHLLHLAGARVIKVESRSRHDGARSGNPAFYRVLNQGKRSIALELGTRQGRQSLQHLIDRADVVIDASRPRALEQLGFDAERQVASRPGLTWVSITGHGRRAPQSEWIAFGDDAGVAAGLTGVMRSATGTWQIAGDAIADPLTGIHAALAAWQSWLQGGSRMIALSLADTARFCLHQELHQLGAGRVAHDFRQWWLHARGQRVPPNVPRRPITDPVSACGADNAQVLAELRPSC